ncbi:MAG: Asp-tRNA(Asn)/Glu-tRNA(Gln) amidotransferase subunit GatB [Chlamydiae bacterium]|nr:MAG: Asp-tRNA(Asn)/Glu-tRNA(Gln) amidotransferase subunit GatB [Chlamydiota bacterium]
MITQKNVEYVANLSRLELDDADMNNFVLNLQKILSYVDKLNELDTSLIEPAAHVLPLRNVKRTDEVNQSLTNKAALQSAPVTSNGFFLVPPVLE